MGGNLKDVVDLTGPPQRAAEGMGLDGEGAEVRSNSIFTSSYLPRAPGNTVIYGHREFVD